DDTPIGSNTANIGTFTNLTVTGNFTGVGAIFSGTVTANKFMGDGSMLTGIIADMAVTANIASTADFALMASTSNFAITALTSTTADYTLLASTADKAIMSFTSTTSDISLIAVTANSLIGSVTTADFSYLASTSNVAITTNFAFLSITSNITLFSITANYSLLASTADFAFLATTADFALLSTTSDIALTSITANYSLLASTADFAFLATTADFAFLSTTADISLTSNSTLALHGYELSADTPTPDDVLKWDGSEWVPTKDFNDMRAEVYDSFGMQTINAPWETIIFDTDAILDSGFTHSSGEITFVEGGPGTRFEVFAKISVDDGTNTRTTGKFRLVYDGTEVPGTLGYTYNRNTANGEGTVVIFATIEAPANNTILKVEGQVIQGTSLVTISNGSILTVKRVR
ncbi:MAG: hypothetical protein HRT90_07485, partial [Candidatus Margulisbacteria bacterium]|nr:hypothetical protein [Candidatus Margulisiibacteriota bacterium]